MKTTKFKLSEIGPIPEEWDVKRYEQVFNHIPSKDYQVQSDQYLEGGRFPIVDQGQEDVVGYTDEDTHLFSVPDGGVIIFGDHTRIVKYRCRDFVVGADGTQLLIGKDASTKFLSYRLRELDIPNLGYSRHFKYVKDALYLMPPKPEQEKIAAALSDVDELLAAMTALIEKKRAIKQGAMQELLEVREEHVDGFKTGFTGFTGLRDDSRVEVEKCRKNSASGSGAELQLYTSTPLHGQDKNPVNPVNPVEKTYAPRRRLAGFAGAWVERRLGDCGKFSKGAGISRAQANTGKIPAVRYGELYTTHTDYIKKFESFISEEVAQLSVRLRHGDIVFACSGETKEEIGKCAAFLGDEIAYAGGDLIIFSPDNGYDSLFLGFELNTPYCAFQKASAGQGDAVVHIRREALEELIVRLPPTLAEQKAIAGVLADMDAEIAALEAKRAKYEQIKQGMMQELLTGRLRLG